MGCMAFEAPSPRPASPEPELAQLRQKVEKLERELRSCKRQVQEVEKLLQHTELLYRSAESNNQELHTQVKISKEKYLRIISPVSPARLHCCYVLIIVLTIAVIALSVALSWSVRKPEQISIKNTYDTCPRNWTEFGSKRFYFSEDTSNWTSSQNFCMELKAQLARFDNVEELNFLKKRIRTFDYWIGLHRESPEHPWRWTDNSEYNSLVPIRGVEKHAYLNNNKISSARIYAEKRWICSKPNSCIL